MNPTKKLIADYLESQGYRVLEDSVHGKNQTRYYHFIVEKAGKKYFCKVNKSDEVIKEHTNGMMVEELGTPPEGVTFLLPAEKLSFDGFLLLLFPYIEQWPVSSESKQFKDFNVAPEDLTTYFELVVKAIEFIATQKLTTMDESAAPTLNGQITKLIERMKPETPYGLEILKYLVKTGEELTERTLTIGDIQPQNMFWMDEDKTITIFDLEEMVPRMKYFDYARLSSYLWFIYGHSDYAKMLLEVSFKGLSASDREERLSYIKFSLLVLLVQGYADYDEPETLERVTEMIEWVRNGLS